MIPRMLLLVAGPSGSGKSRLCRVGADGAGVAALSLDEFYRDHDHPGLPRALGIVDWDDAATFDLDLAVETLARLLSDGAAELPVYDISQSRRTGTRRLDMGTARVLVAEGIFATHVLARAREAGLPVDAIWLDRRRMANFARRLGRDLRERRKPPAILVRRGVALCRSEPALRRQAMAGGFRPMGMRAALAHVTGLVTGSPATR